MKESSVFTFNLVSNTGYEAEGEYPRVSPEQYGQVIAALEGTLKNVSPVKELVKAASKHLEWIEKERQGPVYPEGMSRDSEGGEAIWRKWWNEQLDLCAETEALCRAALAKVSA